MNLKVTSGESSSRSQEDCSVDTAKLLLDFASFAGKISTWQPVGRLDSGEFLFFLCVGSGNIMEHHHLPVSAWYIIYIMRNSSLLKDILKSKSLWTLDQISHWDHYQDSFMPGQKHDSLELKVLLPRHILNRVCNKFMAIQVLFNAMKRCGSESNMKCVNMCCPLWATMLLG